MSRATVAQFLALGGIVGVVLLLVSAPLWAFYVAPLTMTPMLWWKLRKGTV